ncbi:hypothetical protein ES703_118794 [subsurface metagenome]
MHKLVIATGFNGDYVYCFCWLDKSGNPPAFHHIKVVPDCVKVSGSSTMLYLHNIRCLPHVLKTHAGYGHS